MAGFFGADLEQELADGWASLIHLDYEKAVMEEYWRAFEFEALRPFKAEAPLRRHVGESARWCAKVCRDFEKMEVSPAM
jgi:PAS domain-containing protein